MAEIVERTRVSVGVLAKMWGCPTCRIHSLIKSGELEAINAATNPNGRPQYLIGTDAIQQFETARRVH